MEVISSAGRLNPNAPMFVPGAYRAVEDFSEEWWALVHSCPWFRDYWLQERYLDTTDDDDDLLFLPDSLDAGAGGDDDDDEWCYSDYYPHADVEEEEYKKSKELVKVGTMKWQNVRALAQVPRYAEKAPKILKGKLSPRPIQQPK